MQPRSEDGVHTYIGAYPDSFVKCGSAKEAEDRMPTTSNGTSGLIVYELVQMKS